MKALTCHVVMLRLLFSRHCAGLIKVVVSTLSDAASLYLDAKGHAGKKSGHLVLPALLELLHNILKQTSTVVRSALQVCTVTTDGTDQHRM